MPSRRQFVRAATAIAGAAALPDPLLSAGDGPMPERIGMPVICRGLVGVRPPGTATDTT